MERADVEVCDIWLEMIIIGFLYGIYFYKMFFNQASDMAGLNDHTLDITAITIIIAATIKSSFFSNHVWVCMNECRLRGDRGILPPLILLIVPLSTLIQSS